MYIHAGIYNICNFHLFACMSTPTPLLTGNTYMPCHAHNITFADSMNSRAIFFLSYFKHIFDCAILMYLNVIILM